MIKSFRHKGLKLLHEKGDTSKLNQQHVKKMALILDALEVATSAQDLDVPYFRLHALKGDLRDYYAVSVSGNWRIIFQFNDEPENVDLVDYH